MREIKGTERGNMNRKLFLFVIFAVVLVPILQIIQTVSKIGYDKISLPAFAPTLAYLLTILLFKDLYKPIIIRFNKIVLTRTFIAIIFPLVLFTFSFFIGKLIGIEVKIRNDFFSIIRVGILSTIIGAITEEIGWRSFLQPVLEKKYSVIVSSIIVGLIWGLWHINHYKNGLLFILFFLVLAISVSIIIVYLLKNTQFNIIISSLFHVSFNSCFIIFFPDDWKNLIGNIKWYLINYSVWLIAALIFILCGKKYYFNKEK
jgi:membrane protease YdiL (CAAX protease family)